MGAWQPRFRSVVEFPSSLPSNTSCLTLHLLCRADVVWLPTGNDRVELYSVVLPARPRGPHHLCTAGRVFVQVRIQCVLAPARELLLRSHFAPVTLHMCSAYLVFDTQLLITRFDLDDYVWAAITIYLGGHGQPGALAFVCLPSAASLCTNADAIHSCLQISSIFSSTSSGCWASRAITDMLKASASLC